MHTRGGVIYFCYEMYVIAMPTDIDLHLGIVFKFLSVGHSCVLSS